jgi:hypothetical protein
MFPRQLFASFLIGLCILALIVRLVQRGRLDITYCWIWLAVGLGMVVVVLRYDWLLRLSAFIGAVTPTTTLFLLGFIFVLLMCLQFSIVISTHRRQIKRLTQHIALLEKSRSAPAVTDRPPEAPAAP